MTQQRFGGPPRGINGKRSILVRYAAQWPIADKSSDEMLLFVDRIQFEAADLQGVEGDEQKRRRQIDRPSWHTDPMQEVRALMSDIATPPDGDEIHFLCLSSLTEAQREEVLVEAFRDGRAKGAMTARAAGMKLDQLKSAHWLMSETMHGVHELHRRMYLPLLAETPLRTGPYQAIHERPRTAEFNVSVHLTFTLK